jgi:hypothetical protein
VPARVVTCGYMASGRRSRRTQPVHSCHRRCGAVNALGSSGGGHGRRRLLRGRALDLDRDHPLIDTLAVLCREPTYERIGLGGLSRGEVADFLAHANRQEPSPTLVKAIHRETGGNRS